MRWLRTEYLLKGLYLGLLFYVAVQEADWPHLTLVTLLTLGGLALSLAVAAYRKRREGYHPRGRLFAFLLFLLLESPELVYAGVVLGILCGAFALRRSGADDSLLAMSAGGGAALGILFGLLRYLPNRWARFGLTLLLAVVATGGALFWFGQIRDLGPPLGLANPVKDRTLFGAQLLLGVPLFYLLTFAGREEETELEVGAICAALGLASGMLLPPRSTFQSAAILVPVLLYFGYTIRVLPRLRAFKHALRGFSYGQIGRYRQALLCFRRALALEPYNALAREGLWSVHRALDFGQLPNDPETLALIDFDLCLDRAASLLVQPAPGADKLREAQRLLDLVVGQRPATRPVVHYWRAVACTHARHYDQAAAELQQVLDPAGYEGDDPWRRSVLLQAWQLALRSRPELAERVGTPQLALPGRRMEAIAAVERHLADNPEDQEVWGFKRVLYQDLTESEYDVAAPREGPAAVFDHEYAHQLGLALLGDPARWRRGAAYLRIAARGLAAQAPSLFALIAQTYQRQGDGTEAWRNYERAVQAGRAAGPKNLGEQDRQAYFAAVKLLADAALAHQRLDLAIEHYHLYTESERSGVETLRTLADLYERQGDPLSALRATEQALLYSPKDKDLLERKDRYYYSVLPDDLRARRDLIGRGFDVGYCLGKARALLDAKHWDLDTLDWAQHLAELVRVVQPESRMAKALVARVLLRRGEKEEAVALLEEVRSPRPERFETGEDEDAWFQASKLLGEIYLYDLNKPDLAVECLRDYRKSSRSGADTLYKLGQAYEQLGDRTRAVKFYQHVMAYDNHPLAPEAQDALHRLEAR